MKKNCLYTVTPWNTNIFSCGGNKHAFGDFLKKDSDSYMGKWLGAEDLSKEGSAAIGALGTAVGTFGSKLIGGGYDAYGVGNGITSVGNTIGSAVSQVNPLVGGIISAGSGIIGGAVNRLWGMKTDEEALKRANGDISTMRNFISNANTFDNVVGPAAVSNVGQVYKGGVFKKGSARRKNAALQNDLSNAVQFAYNSVDNNIANLQADQYNNLLSNYAAFGGPIGLAPMTGALGIMQADKYINAINNRTSAIAKNNTSPSFSPLGNAFAEGGGIHIKPSHRGLFTEKANRAGMGIQAYASHVLANKEDYPSSTVRQANFARNAKGWKHDAGGSIEGAFLDEFGKDPLGAVMRYNQGLEAMAAQREAEREAAAQQAAYDDLQKRVLAAETQNQGLQSMLDSQGLTIQALMDNQLAFGDSWRSRMPEGTLSGLVPNDNAIMARMRKSLQDRGVTNRVTQDAVIANMMVESGGNPNAKNASSSARGLMQWTKPRHPKAWDWDSQVDHIVNTLESGFGNQEALKRFKDATDSAEAARIFRQYWERPEKHTYNWTDKWIDKMYGEKKAFGGELGTNGTDFTNGLLEINTGSSHEENPHEGVQLGFDEQGIPNLVEEGETVYNDYVFSKRLNVPAFMRKQLGLGGSMKDEITFAAASKKIAEAAKERPNNPMDQEYMDDALGKLAQVQEAERMRMRAERQNDEMERINALPIEGLMQGSMGLEAAYGGQLEKPKGNLYWEGGGLEWLKKNHPEINEKTSAVMGRIMDSVMANNRIYSQEVFSGKLKQDYDKVWREMFKNNNTLEGARSNVQNLIRLGVNETDAYNIVRKAVQTRTPKEARSIQSQLDKDYQGKRYSYTPQETQTQNNSSTPANNSRRTVYRSASGRVFDTNAEAARDEREYWRNRRAEAENTENAKPANVQPAVSANGTSRQNRAVNNASSAPQKPTGMFPDINDYAYDPIEQFEYWDANTNDYNSGYRDFIENKLNEDWISKVMQGNYGDMSRYLGADNSNPTLEQARALGLDTRYSDWHKALAAAYKDYLKENGTPAETPNDSNPNNASPLAPEYQQTNPDYPQGYWGPGVDNTSFWRAAQETGYTGMPATDWQGNATGSNPNAPIYIPDDATVESMTTPSPLELPSVLEERRKDPNDPMHGIGNNDKVKPLPTWMRYAPVFGAGIMTLTDALGLTNKPDYTYANKIEATANRLGYAPNIKYTPIGDYMRYTPLDRLFYANQLQANARATDRALTNTSGGNRGVAQAAMLANGYNTNNNLGNLYRQAEEYNLAQREKVADFNRRTNMFNSQMGLEADMANARYRQQAANYQLQGLAQAAAMRDAIDSRIGAARSANITNLLDNLGALGTQNFALNQINSDRSRRHGVGSNGVSYDKIARAYGNNAFGGEIERNKKNKKQGRRSK